MENGKNFPPAFNFSWIWEHLLEGIAGLMTPTTPQLAVTLVTPPKACASGHSILSLQTLLSNWFPVRKFPDQYGIEEQCCYLLGYPFEKYSVFNLLLDIYYRNI